MTAAGAAGPLAAGFNLFDRSWWVDPYPTYARLLATQPVGRVGPAPLWWACRHADCEGALRDPRLSADDRNSLLVQAVLGQRNRAGPGPRPAGGGDGAGETDVAPRSLLRLDAPDHTRLRSLVAGFFTRAAVDRLRPLIERSVEGMLDRFPAGGVEVMSSLGYPLPITVISEILGVPPAARGRLAALSRHVAAALDPEITIPPAELGRRRAAFDELRGNVRRLIEERRHERRDGDLVSTLVEAEALGPDRGASRGEVVSLLLLLLVAGYETTANLIGNTVLLLARRPELAVRAAESDEACAQLVEEVLRLDPPVQLTSRVTLEEVELGGERVPPGHLVMLLLAAANRDPAAFDDAEEVRLGRHEARVLSFSGGAHHCLGASLARAEATAAVRSLLRRWPALELVEQPRYRETLVLRGLERLVVAPAGSPDRGVRASG